MSEASSVLDKFDCYELCVQSPRHIAAFLRAVHGGEPLVLREDFCGTAALCRRWAKEAHSRGDDGRAVGVDIDPETIDRAAVRAGDEGTRDRIRLVRADVLDEGAAADVIFVGNFSIGYLHRRADLVRYLCACRERLARGNAGWGGGVFVCDTYGGAGAYRLGSLTRRHPGRGREVVHYHWAHEAADPLTGMVENSVSFRVEIDGEIVSELPRAFVYRWRLWSIAELREALAEAGFASSDVYTDVNVAPGEHPVPSVTLPDDWIVCIAARTA